MNKIIYDIKLKDVQQIEDFYYYYKNYTDQLKSYKDKIKLGLYCAKYSCKFNNKYTRIITKKCIDLIEKYLINSNAITRQKLINIQLMNKTLINCAYMSHSDASVKSAFYSTYAAYVCAIKSTDWSSWSLYYCSKIQNINMSLSHQYLQTLFRTTRQFNIENLYSNHIKQIVKQDIDKLELVDYNMLLDISNEHYNIDISDFCYENIFSRRNLIELIRREYNE